MFPTTPLTLVFNQQCFHSRLAGDRT